MVTFAAPEGGVAEERTEIGTVGALVLAAGAQDLWLFCSTVVLAVGGDTCCAPDVPRGILVDEALVEVVGVCGIK